MGFSMFAFSFPFSRFPRLKRVPGWRRLVRQAAPGLAVSTFGLCGAQAASHAPALARDTPLPTIEVVAQPPDTPLVIVMDPKQPRQPLPASDGADYLKSVPGFAAIRNGGTNGDPVFRGMFGSRLNISHNGVPSLGACPGRMDAPTSYIAPETFDKVVVIKGPQSVLYGPGASAGTVLFERRTRRFDAPGLRLKGSLLGASFGRADQNLDVTVGNPDVYARLTANHAHEQDYENGRGQAVPSKWDKWNVDGALGWTPDEQTRLELTAGGGDGYARYASRGMDGASFGRESLGLHFEKKHVGEWLDRLEASIYYNGVDHVMDNYTLRTASMPMVSERRRRTAGARLAATWRWMERFKLITGADFQRHRLDSRAGKGRGANLGQPWTPSATMWGVGGFGELTWYAAGGERWIGGARLDYTGARDDRPLARAATSPNPTVGQGRWRALPSAFLRYEHDVKGSPAMWYAGVGHTQRFPDYWELFSPRRGPSGSVNAFSSLQPERTTQLDVGAQYNGTRLDAWISAYAGVVRNFILFDYAEGQSQASNVGARIMGAEAGTTWRPARAWTVETALAYAWGRNADTGQPLPQIPPLEARVGVEYQRRAWSLGALLRLVAPQHRYALNEGNVVGKDFGPSAGFGLLSLHAQYYVSQSVQVSLGVDNLLNKAYSEHLNMAGNADFGGPARTTVMDPGRTLWARVKLDI